MSSRPLYGLVLAGGESRRMGTDKAALMHHGKSQLEHVFDIVSEVADQAFVSTRASQSGDALREAYPQLIDRHEGIGPLAGILSALETHPGVDWLVVACDLPNVDTKTLGKLVNAAPAGEALIAYRSANDGLPEPLCAIYRAESRDTLERFADEGIVCPRKIMIVSNAYLLDLDDGTALDNVNTPDDLAGSVLEAHS